MKQVALPLNISFLGAVSSTPCGNAQVTFNAQVQSGTQAVPIKIDQLVNFSIR